MTVPHTLTFDASPSARSTDENGFLHVASSHITKATVNPYYGREIPGWREAGLDPEAVYYGFRDPEELKKSLSTWQGLPLHIEHHVDSAEEPARLTRVGAVGRADWNTPYVDAPLTVWDGEAIAAIEDGSFRELSCAYRYDPDFTSGRYEGVEYDFIMRNIRGNHVALVEEGRAGPDVVVADANTVIMDGKIARLGDLEHLIALCKENGLTLSIQPEMARDDRWITVHPNGANNTGRPALIDENGTIKAGMGGKFNGRNIDDVPRGKNPHPVTEEKYQARRQRQAAKAKEVEKKSSPQNKTQTKSGAEEVPGLNDALVQRANGMSALGQAGEYTKREYQDYVDRINQLNLPEAEKRQAIADIHQKLTERLEAESSVASPFASGRARLDSKTIQKSADKASQKSAEAKAIFEKAQSAANKANVAATKQTREAAIAEAHKNGELEAFVGNERWYRANRRSGSWKQDMNYQPSATNNTAQQISQPPGGGSSPPLNANNVFPSAYVSLSTTDLQALVTKGVGKSLSDAEKARIMRQNLAPIEAEAKRIQDDLHRRQMEVWSLEKESKKEKQSVRPWQEPRRTPKESAYLEARSALEAEKARTAEFLRTVGSMNNMLMRVEQRENPASAQPSTRGTPPKKEGATYLNVAYREKDTAKRAGAKWDPDRRQWYMPAGKEVPASLQSKIAADQKTYRGGFMSKLKNWFRGAQDDNPEIEKQEVELAQAIIDLHKVDPVTGEIVDITEDEDKAEEIRRLIGELSAKLDPEEVKKLTDSLTDLACSRATGDERKADAMDEEMKKAMDKCGLDVEDPTASQAFAEGVKYGEELERNPEERRRLDREHESEGMKKAMDACGLDAENPAESRAFAEGVKYGEELIRNPEERRKLDREHEAAGMKKAMGKDEDKNAAITRILDDVPDLTPEQRKRLFDSLQDLAYSPATGDADPSEVKTAQDRAFRSPRHLTAMDAARIKASAIAEAQDHMRGLHQAVRDVRGLVGDLDPLSFDSASDVYGYALKQSGIDPRRYPRQAWRGMIDMLRAGKTAALSGGMARDAAPARLDGKFAGLNNISLAD